MELLEISSPELLFVLLGDETSNLELILVLFSDDTSSLELLLIRLGVVFSSRVENNLLDRRRLFPDTGGAGDSNGLLNISCTLEVDDENDIIAEYLILEIIELLASSFVVHQSKSQAYGRICKLLLIRRVL